MAQVCPSEIVNKICKEAENFDSKDRLLNFSTKGDFQTPLLLEAGDLFFEKWLKSGTSLPFDTFLPLSQTFTAQQKTETIEQFEKVLKAKSEDFLCSDLYLLMGFLKWDGNALAPSILIPLDISPDMKSLSISERGPVENVILRKRLKDIVQLPRTEDATINGKFSILDEDHGEEHQGIQGRKHYRRGEVQPGERQEGLRDREPLHHRRRHRHPQDYRRQAPDRRRNRRTPDQEENRPAHRFPQQEGRRILGGAYHQRPEQDCNNKTQYKTTYSPEVLEKFPNKHPGNDYMVTFNCPEFTSLCPKTGQPDFAEIKINYIPDQFLVESKSLKLYLFSFRNHGDFHEDCVNIIMKDLVKLLDPKYLEVEGIFMPRGGISLYPFANYGKPGTEFESLAKTRLFAAIDRRK